MSGKSISANIINKFLAHFGLKLVRLKDTVDYYLHEYGSYEEYKRAQVHWNKQKLDNIWADEDTLKRVNQILADEFGQKKLLGLCHGTRNGFEQNYLRSIGNNLEVIGTDISTTANNYENSVCWDFHDEREDWTGKHDFVYSNSLDQSWRPKVALQTWLSQLKQNGMLIIEHTHAHGPAGASEMDPFGVRPTVLPYVLTSWFGDQISISHSVKKNLIWR